MEDDQMFRELLFEVIQDTGANVYQAENGLLGLDIIEKEKIDFVLSDIQMPVMDGVEFLKKIKEKSSVTPPVLLVTGQCNISEESAIASGALGLMQKPFRLSELVKLLEKQLLK